MWLGGIGGGEQKGLPAGENAEKNAIVSTLFENLAILSDL